MCIDYNALQRDVPKVHQGTTKNNRKNEILLLRP